MSKIKAVRVTKFSIGGKALTFVVDEAGNEGIVASQVIELFGWTSRWAKLRELVMCDDVFVCEVRTRAEGDDQRRRTVVLTESGLEKVMKSKGANIGQVSKMRLLLASNKSPFRQTALSWSREVGS